MSNELWVDFTGVGDTLFAFEIVGRAAKFRC